MRQAWRLWCHALGPKASADDKEADMIAVIRTIILAIYIVTNFGIVINIIHHW